MSEWEPHPDDTVEAHARAYDRALAADLSEVRARAEAFVRTKGSDPWQRSAEADEIIEALIELIDEKQGAGAKCECITYPDAPDPTCSVHGHQHDAPAPASISDESFAISVAPELENPEPETLRLPEPTDEEVAEMVKRWRDTRTHVTDDHFWDELQAFIKDLHQGLKRVSALYGQATCEKLKAEAERDAALAQLEQVRAWVSRQSKFPPTATINLDYETGYCAAVEQVATILNPTPAEKEEA